MAISARALHFVLKIGDRKANINFFRNVLGMKVLRHEEFQEGCEAQCNGPYENRWSKTMIGYGDESSHFVVELTYNYGVKSYDLGNDFHGITIQSKETVERIKTENYPFTLNGDGKYVLNSPDGYQFFVFDEATKGQDPVKEVALNTTDIEKTQQYWHSLLNMKVLEKSDSSLALTYGENQASLAFKKVNVAIDRKTAYGRIAFAVPYEIQPVIEKIVKENNQPILKDLVTLPTPGKADVRVIILSDPNQLEICFVDEEGFSQLSQFDPKGDADLEKYIKKDPFQ